jgi:hypothetical protein
MVSDPGACPGTNPGFAGVTVSVAFMTPREFEHTNGAEALFCFRASKGLELCLGSFQRFPGQPFPVGFQSFGNVREF